MRAGLYSEQDCIDAIMAGMLASRILPASRSLVPAMPSISRARGTRRVLITHAQDDTDVHLPFWQNMHAYAEHIGAEIMVGGTTYQKGLFEDHQVRTAVFRPEVHPYLHHERVEIGPIQFCAELNILVTAVNPISALQTYSRARPAVIHHPKQMLESIPAMPMDDVPIIATTGSVTVENYVEKKAGQKARFHHVIGCLLVELDEDGDWFFRHINADSADGSFQDLDCIVRNGQVTTGHRIEAITWGDIHREQLDPVNAMTAWGVDITSDTCVSSDTMLDALRPKYQFFHDLLDFRARNHHSRWDPHHLFEMVANGTDSVEAAVDSCARFLRAAQREWCQSVVIESNHDRALMRWLKEANWREDPVNAQAYLRWNGKVLEAIAAGNSSFNIFREALREADAEDLAGIEFVPVDGSYRVAGIEQGMHGDFGSNGARGSLVNLTRLSMKTNTGHVHTAGIRESSFCAGMNGKKNQGYNKGPSSWTPTDILTYANGKRTLITKRGRKWRAA